jgi:NADH dehydrogenase FAD-containing subunit
VWLRQLVIAVGSTTNDFGTQGAAQHCLFLDTRKQAERFHQQLLNHYLRAHAGQTDVVEKISVAIVGAGATGVELAPSCTTPPMNWRPMAWTASSRKTCTSP